MPLTPEQTATVAKNREAALRRRAAKRSSLDIVALVTPKRRRIMVNRSPVLTLWAAVVAERALQLSWPEGLSLGRAVASLCAQRKGEALGLMDQRDETPTEDSVGLLGFQVAVVEESEIRGLVDGSVKEPDEGALERKFGDAYNDVRAALRDLAMSYSPAELNDGRRAYDLYTAFRPVIPSGRAGWGVNGPLDLSVIENLTNRNETSSPPS